MGAWEWLSGAGRLGPREPGGSLAGWGWCGPLSRRQLLPPHPLLAGLDFEPSRPPGGSLTWPDRLASVPRSPSAPPPQASGQRPDPGWGWGWGRGPSQGGPAWPLPCWAWFPHLCGRTDNGRVVGRIRPDNPDKLSLAGPAPSPFPSSTCSGALWNVSGWRLRWAGEPQDPLGRSLLSAADPTPGPMSPPPRGAATW